MQAVTRLRLRDKGGVYFPSSDPNLSFIRSGCTVLDMVLGGGWPLGRIVNVIGDQSTGKTLIAIEAMANFCRQYPNGKVSYYEAESAFSVEYAKTLGMPVSRVELRNDGDVVTVESFYKGLDKFMKGLSDEPGLFILDSLDALTDEAELNRTFGEDSYGVNKAKQMSQMFRRLTSRIEKSKVCLMIISQTRDRIGGGFGRKYTRSGGRALDFYASIVVYLAHIKELTRTIKGIKRPVGIEIKVRCTKNKVSLPFRTCTFPILFGFGIEDITAGLDWLQEHKKLDSVGLTEKDYSLLRRSALNTSFEDGEREALRSKIAKAVRKSWWEVEKSFLPRRGKYSES